MFSRIALAALCLACTSAFVHAEEYRLQPGDVLELVVVTPPIREQMHIDIDGKISLPVVGPVAAGGRTVAEVAAEARELLSGASLPPMTPGETLPLQIWPAAVTLSLREYGPVYIGGDVRAGGAFPFTPGLTARRAIVLAGGNGRLADSELRRLELEGALAQLTEKRAAAAARLDRLRLEIDPAARGTSLPATERAILDLRREQDVTAGRHFDTAIRHTEAQIADLGSQLATETEGMTADREDFERIEELREAGTATVLRLSDARRALLFSTTRQLETATELARTTRELGSVQYEELRRTLDLQLEALTDAAATEQLVAELDVQIAATRGQLTWLDRVAGRDAPATVSISGSDGVTIDLAPAEDRALHPGDLVTVSLAAEAPSN